ncbi:MAG TPA: rhomboid family intramembrane serine protease [Myxococcales bacterium]|jgi:membrane associated rhomboid family serine protease|nr:rhomboid family intramembrane serine protease [Myxococcales bacterium]
MSPRGQPAMSFGVPPLTRGVKWLGGITLAVSILVRVIGASGEELARLVVFVPEDLWHGRIWQPFTYTFLNPDPFGLLFALLGLWLLGASLEQAWGTRRFVVFYLATGALAAVATALLGLAVEAVRFHPYAGNWPSLEGLIAAFAVLMPNAQIFLYFVPVQARWMLPISAGITVLFMVMTSWVAYLPQLFGLGAGVLLAGGVAPRNFLLRARVWWIDRRLRRSKLRVIRGGEEKKPGPFGSGPRGSDKYLH